MDLTGQFPATSSQGNSYILVVYDFDSNGILIAPLKNCKAEVILEAYKLIHNHLCAAGLRPQLQRLDNEASQALQDYLYCGKSGLSAHPTPHSLLECC